MHVRGDVEMRVFGGLKGDVDGVVRRFEIKGVNCVCDGRMCMVVECGGMTEVTSKGRIGLGACFVANISDFLR